MLTHDKISHPEVVRAERELSEAVGGCEYLKVGQDHSPAPVGGVGESSDPNGGLPRVQASLGGATAYETQIEKMGINDNSHLSV